jgi:uncharacterized protein YxjI
MKFYIKQKVFTFKDKFTVMDEQQNIKYEVKGKFMSIKNKLELTNQSGEILLRSERKVLSFMPTYFIFDSKNQEIAMVKRIFGFKPKFNLRILHNDYYVDGSLFGHSFGIYDSHNNLVTSISKKIISWGDTYEIDVVDENNLELLLFMVIIIDQVVHENKNNR